MVYIFFISGNPFFSNGPRSLPRNGTAISTFFALPAAGVFRVIFIRFK